MSPQADKPAQRHKPVPAKPAEKRAERIDLSKESVKRTTALPFGGPCGEHDFQVNVHEAVAEQLVRVLESSHAHPLSSSDAPERPGVYALYERKRREPIYVGKAATSLRHRLGEHSRKVGASGLKVDQYECRYLAVAEEWWVVLAETYLIRKYRPPWNGAGFAAHVPGRGRPGLRKSRWQRFLDGEISLEEAARQSLKEPVEE